MTSHRIWRPNRAGVCVVLCKVSNPDEGNSGLFLFSFVSDKSVKARVVCNFVCEAVRPVELHY